MIIVLLYKTDNHINTRYARNNTILFIGFIINLHASIAINNNMYNISIYICNDKC